MRILKATKDFVVRLLKNHETNCDSIFDKILISTESKDYEFIPMPTGWLCIVTMSTHQVTSCFIPDPKHSLRLKITKSNEFTDYSHPLDNLGIPEMRD